MNIVSGLRAVESAHASDGRAGRTLFDWLRAGVAMRRREYDPGICQGAPQDAGRCAIQTGKQKNETASIVQDLFLLQMNMRLHRTPSA